MNRALHGYFSEITPLWPHQVFSLKVKEELYHEKSKYQDIRVLKSETYGNVLVLDGIIQMCEKDEFTYSEMIVHPALFCHPAPKNVLVIGGGDGGAIREALKHPEVETVHWCEIDEKVIDVSRKYLTAMNVPFDSPKLTLHIEDGVRFVERYKDEFDAIIVDSSDPIGPAIALYERPFYETVYDSLKDDGVLCSLGDCYWFDDCDFIPDHIESLKTIFPVVDYSICNTPTYPCGLIGFFVACKNKDRNLKEPLRIPSDEVLSQMNMKYYSPEVHGAAYVLPPFFKRFVHRKTDHDEKNYCNGKAL